MSAKKELAQAVAALPEALSLEEAIEQLRRIFTPRPSPAPARRLGTLSGQVWMAEDFDAPLPASVLMEFEGDS